MGLIFQEYLPGPRIFKCSNCKAHSAAHDQIYSKHFQGRFGRAYLFNSVVNVCLGPKEDRLLLTGLHTVNDIYCKCCHQIMGWRYEKAYDDQEKYKEGKYIMEKTRMLKEGWQHNCIQIDRTWEHWKCHKFFISNCTYYIYSYSLWKDWYLIYGL